MLQFEAKQVVWAKINGYPWWPALITKIPKSPAEDYRINFFGEKHYAYVPGKNLAKYKDMYNQHASAKGKNHAPQNCIKEADNYIKDQKGIKQPEPTNQTSTDRRRRPINKPKVPMVEAVQEPPLKRRQSQIKRNYEPVIGSCEVLEVDFKKLNRIQSEWKVIIESFIRNQQGSRQQTIDVIKTFDFSSLNDQQLWRTKITNSVKYLQNASKQSGEVEMQNYFSVLFDKLKNRVMDYMCSTNYYEQFLITQAPQQEEQQKPEPQSPTNFEHKVLDLLRKNYHFKKDNARVLSDHLSQRLQDWVLQKKIKIIKQLKNKTKELKPGRREHITGEEIQRYIDKIMED